MDLSKIKIAIAIPHTAEWIPTQFFETFFCLDRPFDMTFIRPTGHFVIDMIRNLLVEQARVAKCSHIFMADTDQTYPRQDIMVRMLSHGLPVVGAKIHMRYPPFDPVLKRYAPNGYPYYVRVPKEEWNKDQLIQVDATGTGCLLIDMKVFEKIEPPYFKMSVDTDPAIGEDVYFCNKVRQAGIPITVDCGIKVGHLKTITINEEEFFSFISVMEQKNKITINEPTGQSGKMAVHNQQGG